MARAYSEDLRGRVIAAVEAGQSARQAARLFLVSPSTAIKWVQRWRRSGSFAATLVGGRRRSPLDHHAGYLLALVGEQPDLTLAEIRDRLQARAVPAGITSVWRFFDRHGVSFKKNPARRRARSPRRGGGEARLAGGAAGA